MDLLKSLIIHQHPIDLITIIASLTLSHKYQHAQSHTIDYHLIQQSCHIHNIQLIHVSLVLHSTLIHPTFIFISSHLRMPKSLCSMCCRMISVWQHPTISSLIYPVSPTMITLSNRSSNELDRRSPSIHSHIRHWVGAQETENDGVDVDHCLLFRSSPQLSIEYCRTLTHLHYHIQHFHHRPNQKCSSAQERSITLLGKSTKITFIRHLLFRFLSLIDTTITLHSSTSKWYRTTMT